MKVLIAGGGTAGHVNPAIAIAEIIDKKLPGSEIAFVGRPIGIENDLFGATGRKMYHIKASGFYRSLSPKNFVSLYRMIASPIKAKRIIREFAPDVVIGTGGYVCYPLVKAAVALGVPTLLHESNAVPGLAVKMLAQKVSSVLLNFEESAARLEEGVHHEVVGNPTRSGFSTLDRESTRRALGIADDEKLIVSFGGSLGAARVNEACAQLMKEVSLPDKKIRHIHATGKREYDTYSAFRNQISLLSSGRCTIQAYINNMPELLSAADLVISRSGAMTLTELAASACPAILIPSPNVTDNHQYKNAKVLADAGAALLLEESSLGGSALSDAARRLLNDSHARGELSRRISAFARKDANDLVFDAIMRIASTTKDTRKQ